MTNSVEKTFIYLGNEPPDVLGFKTEEQIEIALIPLMADLVKDELMPI